MLLGKYALAAVLLAGITGFAGGAAAQTCDDFDPCTTPDMCSAGECIGTPVSSGSCDDGDPCTGNDTCTAGGCVGTPTAGASCKDFNDCTTDDRCVDLSPGPPIDPIIICQGTPRNAGAECEGGCGTCQQMFPFPGVPFTCFPKEGAQGTPCTPPPDSEALFPCFDHTCRVITSAVTLCSAAFQPRVCPDTDGNPCTDNCNFANGQCERNAPKCQPNCETCNQTTGECQPANVGNSCDDLDPCTAQSSCQPFEIPGGVRGLCVAGAPIEPTATPTVLLPTLTAPTSTPTVPATVTVPTSTATSVPPTATSPPSTPTATRTRIQGTPTATLPPEVCVGDCNSDGHVRTNEIILGVEIALDRAELSLCSPFDPNDDSKVLVDEIVAAVNGALHGCTSAAAATR